MFSILRSSALVRAFRQDLSWPSLAGALGATVIAAVIFRFLLSRYGLCPTVCGKQNDSEGGSRGRSRQRPPENESPQVTIHINLGSPPHTPSVGSTERDSVSVPGIPVVKGSGTRRKDQSTRTHGKRKHKHGEGGSKKPSNKPPASL